MTFIACIVPVLLFGHPDIAAMSGYLLQKTTDYYVVDFSNAASAIEGISGDYSKVRIDKIDCSNVEDKK